MSGGEEKRRISNALLESKLTVIAGDVLKPSSSGRESEMALGMTQRARKDREGASDEW